MHDRTCNHTENHELKPCMDLDFTHAIKTSGTMRKITRMCAVVTGRYCIVSLLGYLLCYWCDTDRGSSGAPVVKVIDEVPQVIALHRGGRSKGASTLITAILTHVQEGKMPSDCKCCVRTIG